MPLAPDELARRAVGGFSAPERPAPAWWSPARVRSRLTCEAIVQRILRRGRWSLHRHVHLVAAFEEVAGRSDVRSLLSVGSGAALSELYLAAAHPDLRVVVTDLDGNRLARVARLARRLRLANVELRPLDLLADADADDDDDDARFDLVVGVEVLEHIDDDRLAAQRILALSRDFVYQLVPSATPAELADPRAQRRAWARHQHFRPGYTGSGLGELFAGSRPDWIRSCYFAPDADRLRTEIGTATTWTRLRQGHRLVARACLDVRTELVDQGAAGLEILTRVRADRPDQAWVRPSGPTNS